MMIMRRCGGSTEQPVYAARNKSETLFLWPDQTVF